MGLNSPLPQSLNQECLKSIKILDKIIKPTNKIDSIIPPHILKKAKGLFVLIRFYQT